MYKSSNLLIIVARFSWDNHEQIGGAYDSIVIRRNNRIGCSPPSINNNVSSAISTNNECVWPRIKLISSFRGCVCRPREKKKINKKYRTVETRYREWIHFNLHGTIYFLIAGCIFYIFPPRFKSMRCSTMLYNYQSYGISNNSLQLDGWMDGWMDAWFAFILRDFGRRGLEIRDVPLNRISWLFS